MEDVKLKNTIQSNDSPDKEENNANCNLIKLKKNKKELVKELKSLDKIKKKNAIHSIENKKSLTNNWGGNLKKTCSFAKRKKSNRIIIENKIKIKDIGSQSDKEINSKKIVNCKKKTDMEKTSNKLIQEIILFNKLFNNLSEWRQILSNKESDIHVSLQSHFEQSISLLKNNTCFKFLKQIMNTNKFDTQGKKELLRRLIYQIMTK